jgi:hypothetical protein
MSGETEKIQFLEGTIESHRQLRRLQLALALFVLLLGIASVVVLQWFSAGIVPDNVKQLGSLGGGFLATLSSFPLKQLYDRGFKIAALELLLAGFKRMAGGQVSSEEAAGLQQRFDKIWDVGLAT